MTDRTLTALYDTKAAAEAAKTKLLTLGIPGLGISIHDEGSAGAMGASGTTAAEGGMLSGLKNLFGAHEDTHAYAEGLRRGHFLLSAKVDEMKTDAAVQVLEDSGAVDFDAQQSEWKMGGWSAPAMAASTALAGRDMTADRDEAIPIVEERLVVGKREVERGGVRVRSYVVETPVEEQISLRDEHVDVERRVVDRAVAAGEDPFLERTLQMTETGEEAVVGKQAYVIEEIGLKKEVGQRTEEVRDTVRHTEVEVERTDADGSMAPAFKRV